MSVDVREELRRQLTVSRISGQEITVWDHWQLYLNPPLTATVAGMLEDELRAFVDHLDYLCPIPKGGMPLGSTLAHRLGLPVLNFWWDRGIYCQDYIPRSPRLVLFDPDVRSGWALRSALLELEPIQPRIECLLTVIYHDTYPSAFTVPLKETWHRQRKIVHLFTMSELLDSGL